jgi:hypothetical protein
LVNNSVFFYFGEFQENFNSGALSVFSKIERVAEIDGRAQALESVLENTDDLQHKRMARSVEPADKKCSLSRANLR